MAQQVALSPRDRTLTLVGILMALFLGALDQTIVATALPRIVSDLHGLDRYAWVATAHLLASTVLVPIYGKLSDMISRKTIELFAVAIIVIADLYPPAERGRYQGLDVGRPDSRAADRRGR